MPRFKPLLLLLTALSLTACAAAPGAPSIPSPNPSVPMPVPVAQPARLQLLNADRQPLAGLSVRFQAADQYTDKGVWLSATTDAQGALVLPDSILSEGQALLLYLQLEAPGYWGYQGYIGPPASGGMVQLQLAAKTPEELTGTPVSALLFRLNVGIFNTSETTLGEQFPENKQTRFMTFVATHEAELDAVLNKFKNFDAKQFTSLTTGELVAYEALMRQALKDGKVLVGYSNGEFFRYGAMVDSVVKSDGGYYISSNRTQLLSNRGMSGHSYDYEMQVFAFEPNVAITMHTAIGKQILRPMCRCLPGIPESQQVQYVTVVEQSLLPGPVTASPAP